VRKSVSSTPEQQAIHLVTHYNCSAVWRLQGEFVKVSETDPGDLTVAAMSRIVLETAGLYASELCA
jgi:hypothetical protein